MSVADCHIKLWVGSPHGFPACAEIHTVVERRTAIAPRAMYYMPKISFQRSTQPPLAAFIFA